MASWTYLEEQAVRDAEGKLTLKQVAANLWKTEKSVRDKAKKMGVQLKSKTEQNKESQDLSDQMEMARILSACGFGANKIKAFAEIYGDLSVNSIGRVISGRS